MTAITARRFSINEMTFKVPDRGSGNPHAFRRHGIASSVGFRDRQPYLFVISWNRTTDPSPVVPCTRKSAVSLRKALRSNIAV